MTRSFTRPNGHKALALASLAVLLIALFSATATTYAAHESNNHLDFAPVAASPSPSATGSGIINYIKGTSGDEPFTSWTSNFHFSGLQPDTAYSVVVKGRFTDNTLFSSICDFITDAQGRGICQNQFTGLQRLAVAQLRLGGAGGAVVLQATRLAVVSGPGMITSNGACREAPQVGCEAPAK